MMSASLRPTQLAHGSARKSSAAAVAVGRASTTTTTTPRIGTMRMMPSRRRAVVVAARFVLTPTGDGSLSHLDAEDAAAVSRAIEAGVISRSAPLPLPEGLHEVGREQPAEIVLPVPTVSARHARVAVARDAGAVVVSDLGSTNGTYVDGSPLEPMSEVSVSPGQEVVFGDQYLAKYRLDVEDE